MPADLADAVEGPAVQLARAVRLALQPDPDVLDGPAEDRVGDAGEGARRGVLRVRQPGGAPAGLEVARLEVAAGCVEGAKLDRDAGTDADEGGQRALVEGQCALLLVD